MPEKKKSILVNTSRIIPKSNNLEGGEETEITTQISVPQEGGWGWVVVGCAAMCIMILDGVAYTFGSLLKDITEDLNKSEALIALVNSIAIALYFICGPIVSALINRFGFRACTMSGAVICSFSLFISYFANHYTTFLIFYGFCAGFGYSLINLSSGLVVGFYFERLRSVAISISTVGSSLGVMFFFPLNAYLVQIGGWRTTTLLQSGLFGLVYFSSMAFRPLLSLSLAKGDDATRTVTYLPSISVAKLADAGKELVPTATEKLFGAVSNYNFPTAAKVIKDDVNLTQAGPSNRNQSKLLLTVNNKEGGISRMQLKQVQSILSTLNEKDKNNIEIAIKETKSKERGGCCGRLCFWDDHVPESRPMYRDDAFYQGDVKNLPEYKKSQAAITDEARTGLEYRMAVTRAAAVSDLNERRGVFTTSVRRVLATMLDLKLLKTYSFMILCFSGFCTFVGFLVPYVYLKDRNALNGIASAHCTWFVSAIGFSNIFGRIFLGMLAAKLEPVKIMGCTLIIAGIATALSCLSYSVYFQYGYCVVFGFNIASVGCLRSMVLVSLYGLDKLTNAAGMLLLFQGLGSLFSTPIASVLKDNFGFNVAFIVAGIAITLSGVFLLPLKGIQTSESNSKKNDKKNDKKHEAGSEKK